MYVRLISEDDKTYDLCRQVLAELAPDHFRLIYGRQSAGERRADVYLWDCDLASPNSDDFEIPDDLSCIFLVGRKNVRSFVESFPVRAVRTLIKPVNRYALRAFLEYALRSSSTCSDLPGKNRAKASSSQDDVLQCLFEVHLKLQEYVQDRTTFLARASHDFRIPLTAVGGYTGLLLEGKLGPLTGDQRHVLERMHYSINRLTRMSTALFQVSLDTLTNKKPEMRRGDIVKCIERSIHEVVPLAAKKAIRLATHFKAPRTDVFFEADQIAEVLANLLENACKFTPSHSEIEVHAYSIFLERRNNISKGFLVERRRGRSGAPNAYRVDVSDSGPGLSPEQLATIFEPQGTGLVYSRTGAGLGLAICKTIISAHQGKLFAESAQKRTTFSFVLPFQTCS